MLFRSQKTGRWVDELRVAVLGILGTLIIVGVLDLMPVPDELAQELGVEYVDK